MKGLCLAAAGAFASVCGATELPTKGAVVNIVEWDSEDLPRVHQRSGQFPLSEVDLLGLLDAGFNAEQLAIMVRERRYQGDVSAQGLVRLKKLGLEDALLGEVSLHALPPNRGIDLTIVLTFEGEGSHVERDRYLCVIIPDGETERVLLADLNEALATRSSARTDHSDYLLPEPVRTLRFGNRLPLKSSGARDLTVLISARPDIRSVEDLTATEKSDLATHVLDYPASSVIQDCRLDLRFDRDALLADKWMLIASRLECEWN